MRKTLSELRAAYFEARAAREAAYSMFRALIVAELGEYDDGAPSPDITAMLYATSYANPLLNEAKRVLYDYDARSAQAAADLREAERF